MVFKVKIGTLLGSKRIDLFLCCVVLKTASGTYKCSNIFWGREGQAEGGRGKGGRKRGREGGREGERVREEDREGGSEGGSGEKRKGRICVKLSVLSGVCDMESERPVNSCLYHPSPVCPWANYSTPLILSFLVWKKGSPWLSYSDIRISNSPQLVLLSG